MLSAMPTPNNKRVTTFAIALGALGLLNVAFYLLSASYFASHRELVNGALVSAYTPDMMLRVRIVFGVFSAIVCLAGSVAVFQPRVTGHVIAIGFGVAYVIAAIYGLSTEMPGVLVVTWMLGGGLLAALGWRSFFQRSRAAWSIIVAICGVFALCELFGAPKIARGLDISLWLAMVAPALKVVATVALVSLRDEYPDPSPAVA